METSFPVSSHEEARAWQMVNRGRPLVIAHRGYSAIAPENTLPSFTFALQAGADLVELDYYHSQDGAPVVFHDSTLDRTTNARELWREEGHKVGTRTWEELCQLDAGAWFHPRYAGAKLLPLEEAVDLIQSQSMTLIERKSGDPETLLEMLRRKDLVGNVVVQSFDWEFIHACHRLEPALVLGALGPPDKHVGQRLPPEERVLNSTFLDRIAATGAKVVGWNHQVTEAAIDDAHNRGLRVWAYVINDLSRANELLDIGIDGLITDNAGLIWKALALHRVAHQAGGE